ncbi:MAG: amino acid adenylation domain-containing protein [Bacteroidales bacterium]|nr:amino acid adenylation domain-containing protein [Bacteroidales bacterium]
MKEMNNYPLINSQLGIYFYQINNTQSCVYNNPFCINISKNDNVDIFKLANDFKALVNNHKVFSVAIDVIEGIPSMILDQHNFEYQLCKVDEDDIQNQLEKFVKPFDLKNDTLVRLTIFETQNNFYFAFDVSHIVLDGTTLINFMNELSARYNNQSIVNENFTIFDLAIQEQNAINSDEYKNAEKFFSNIFDGNDFTNNFEQNNFIPNNNIANYKTIYISDDLSPKNIKNFTSQIGITTNDLLLSAYQYTLAKFNGTEKSIVCMVESGRKKMGDKNPFGMLVKTLPEPIDFSNLKNIKDFLVDNHNFIRQTFDNNIYPFTNISSKYGLNIDFLYVYQPSLLYTISLNNKLYNFEHIKANESMSKISLEIVRQENDFRLNFIYREDLYDNDLINSFIETYIQVIREFLTKNYFSDINLLPKNQVEKLDFYNQTEQDYEQTDFVSLFKKQVEIQKDKIALVFNNKQFSYNQLDKISNKIANYIHQLNIKNDDVVSILIPRNEFMVISTLGVLKSGACYQPLDTSYPKERLMFMVQDANAKLLITTKQLEPLIENYHGNILYLDDIENLTNDNDLNINILPNNLFVLLYTSGSTGVPKGVMIEHKNVVALYNSNKQVFNISENSKLASYPSFGFDAFVMDFSSVMLSGATIYILPDEIRLDIVKMDEFFIKNNITHGFMTTQVGRQFVDYTKCNTLTNFMVGGESLVPIDVNSKNINLINGYGPSESLAYISSFSIDKLYNRVPIGKASKNIKLYVVDKNLKRLPFGMPGELLVAGHQVSRGYLNRPEKNAEAFIQNPFSNQEGYKKIYRTGDTVRILPDGNIDFIGRTDGQVKIRGFRIELTEIESVIREFDDINDVTVQAFDRKNGGKFITAYIVSDNQIDTKLLKDFILSKKPPYMVPEVIMQIDKIPLNVNSKVDKRALPTPEFKIENIIAPKNDMQQKIFDFVAQIIDYNNFSIDTDLFFVGLTSIGCIKLNVLIANQFGVSIQISDLKENNTIEKLEQFIINNSNQTDEFQILDNYPITKTQEGVFVECLSLPNSTIYNIPLLIKIDQSIDIQKLKSSIAKVVNAHSYIKTQFFYDENDNLKQKPNFSEFIDNQIEIINSNNINDIKDNLIKPFELLNNQLFRIKIIQADFNYLFLDFHHVIFDGTSMVIFLEDISKVYNNIDIQDENYSGFQIALNEQKNRNSDKLNIAKSHYDNLLNGLDADFLPKTDLYKTSKHDSGTFTYCSNKILTDDVFDFTSKNSLSVNGFLCSVFGFLLAKYNNIDYSIFTTIYNGRNDSRSMRSLSMLVKTLPVVCQIKNQETLKYSSNISEQIFNSMTNDIYSFAEISHEYQVNANVMFIYQGDNFDFNSFCDKKVEIIPLNINNHKADFTIQVYVNNGIFNFVVDYNNNLYSENYIKSFVFAFEKTISQFVEKQFLNDISILSDYDFKLLENFNNTFVDYNKSETILDYYNRVVKQYPDNIAVVYNDNKISFSQLDIYANKIANFLHAKGIKPDDFVPILVSRNEFMSVATIGVIKAGAAYQPLDSTYPAERLNFMINDTKAKVVILERNLKHLIQDYKGELLFTDEIENLDNSNNFVADIKPNNAFAILYTSGTTGVPKGCVLEHKSMVALLINMFNFFKLNPNSRIATYASFGFDASMCELFCSYMVGASVYIVPEDIRLDIKLLEKIYNDNQITQTIMTTQVGRMFVTQANLTSLKYIMVGGETLVPLTPPNNFVLYNGYGPSEATNSISAYQVKDDSQLLPIGKIYKNAKSYIVDKNNKILPIGACGELLISGPQVGRGYLNRPEKTAEVFIKNTFSDDIEHKICYKTGDIVRMLPDGNIDFIGRRDSQVKIRGFRVELTEVEGIIREYPNIKDATVQAFNNPSGGKFIAGYIVSDKKIDIQDLNNFIISKKPPYMVPAVTMQIDAIPLNNNSKVNKKLLPIPKVQSLTKGEEPKNETEKVICNIFQDVIQIDKVYANDDFFAIGGTSISAVQVIVKLNKHNFDVVYKNLFENSTPQKLAKFLDKGESQDFFAPSGEDLKKYDYSALEYNVIENLKFIKNNGIGDVLLTGVTGFLGAHVFKEIIDTTQNNVICLIRSKKDLSAVQRMEMFMTFYFEDWYSDSIRNRTKVIDCDINDVNLVQTIENEHFNTIINCAGNVKHFAEGDTLMRDNFSSVENLIKVAQNHNAKLIQTSSLSVCGESIDGKIPPSFKFKENNLNIGQSLENKYTRSKYLAEQIIIDKISRHELTGKIIRLGNLMARNKDGEFQINSQSNAFLKQFVGYKELGCYPVDMMDAGIEFSPIDCVAKAVVLLAGTPDDFTVFHAKNCHEIHYGYFINSLINSGFKIDIVEQDEFENRFKNILENDDKDLTNFTGFIAYLNKANASPTDVTKYSANQNKTNFEHRVRISSDTTFTTKALYRLGFAWPLLGEEYFKNMINILKEMDFFNE